MLWTNKYNLPDRVIRVLKGKYKDRKPELNRLSITDLIDGPLPRILFINHWDDIVRDYSDLLTMVQGIAIHSRYEECATDDDDSERKYEDVIDGIIVVGKADLSPAQSIIEVKQTGVYGPKYRIPKWEKQMNMYAWEKRTRGGTVNELLVDIWYRDWKQGNIHWRDYPAIPYECIRLTLWDFEKQNEYIHNQVAKHLAHPIYDTPQEYTKPCSDKQRGIRWEMYKGKNKTPTKVEDTFDGANKWCQEQSIKFEIRKSEAIFCSRYCKSRSVCPFSGVKQ